MSGKRVLGRVVLGVFLVFLFLSIQYLGDNPYFTWYFRSLYLIESARVESRLLASGEMEVHETIRYRMRKPFRGVFREIPPARYEVMEGVKLWTEDLQTQDVELTPLPRGGFSARVWLVPRGSTYHLDPRKNPWVTLHVTYRVKGVVENGRGVAQLFRQLWGEWDAPARLVEGVFDLPPQITVKKLYTHPRMSWERMGNHFLIRAWNLPPQSIAEVRLVTDPLPTMPYAVSNPTLTLQEVEEAESGYRSEIRNLITPWMVLLLIFLLLLLLIFLLLGREVPVEYQRSYEQEPPYADSPDLVNAVVRHLTSRVGEEGVAAALLDLYHRGYIDFAEGKDGSIILKEGKSLKDLPPSQERLLELLQKFATGGVFRFDTLRERLEGSVADARSFNVAFEAYQKEIFRELQKRRYLQSTGNILAKVLAFLMMLLSTVVVESTLRPVTAHLLPFLTLLSGVFFFGGGMVLATRKDVFGRWSKEGRIYSLRWQSFARFLSDYSLLAERPPQSVAVWEKYLVYATALGIAREVMKNLEKLVPREVFERESPHPYFYHPGIYLMGGNFYSLHTAATSTIAQSQASSRSGGFRGGGFSGGAGGFGGGSGGGRGGAF